MTLSPARRRDVVEHPTPKVITDMIKRLEPGWRTAVVHGEGHVLRKPTDPDTRKQYEQLVPVRSASLRARHADGRAFCAVWVAEHQPEHWAERAATKRMGARSVYVAARWVYSYEWGAVWTLCTDPACPSRALSHPRATPILRNATELNALLAQSAPAERQEVAA